MSVENENQNAPSNTETFLIADEPRGVLLADGKDTASFLNRLLTYAIDTLHIGQGCRPFLLNARGRIVATFACLRLDAHRFLLEAEEEQLSTLKEALEMFHFAEDFSLVRAEYEQISIFGHGAEERLNSIGVKIPTAPWGVQEAPLDGMTLTLVNRPDRGLPWFTVFLPSGTKNTLLDELKKVGVLTGNAAQIDQTRIEMLHPRWPNEYNEQRTPLDVSGLDGMTDGKGCYPGQEVIERTLAIGRPARSLRGVESDFPLNIGTKLYWEDAEAGEITSAAQRADGSWTGLASLKSRYMDKETWRSEFGDVARRDST